MHSFVAQMLDIVGSIVSCGSVVEVGLITVEVPVEADIFIIGENLIGDVPVETGFVRIGKS